MKYSKGANSKRFEAAVEYALPKLHGFKSTRKLRQDSGASLLGGAAEEA